MTRVFMIALLVLTAACRAQPAEPPEPPKPPEAPEAPEPAEQPASVPDAAVESVSPPASRTEVQAAPAPPASDEVVALLDRAEAKAKEITTLRADLRYDRVQGLVGDEQRRFGKLVYVAGPPRRFAIHFDRLVVDGNRLERQNRWYIFDGTWLVERLDDRKQFLKRQIIAPGTPAERADPLALGEGPFALPLNQDKDLLLRRFTATIPPPAKTDPKHTTHLRLVPRAGQRADFVEVDIWYDNETLLPVQARTVDASENESTIRITNPQVNVEVDPGEISTAEPQGQGWDVQVQPWEK